MTSSRSTRALALAAVALLTLAVPCFPEAALAQPSSAATDASTTRVAPAVSEVRSAPTEVDPRALAPLVERGCTACHSLDGAPGQGPTFVGLVGSHHGAYRDGERVSVHVDDAYLARAITEPNAEITEGFGPGFMPRYRLEDAERDALIRALHAVPSEVAPSPGTWWPLGLGLFLFVIGHLALSSSPWRGWMIARLGERGFLFLYSALAFAGLGLVVWGYARAPYVMLFQPSPWMRWIPNLAMPLAFVLLTVGMTTPSPTAAGQGARAAEGPHGIVRITRHPGLWGFALWGLAHVPANGDLRSSLVFLSVAFLAFAGMVHIDLRRAQTGGEAWERFERATSIVPFWAIARGRQTLALRELGVWRVVLGLVIWAGVFHLHRWLLGVSPLP